MLKTSLIFVFLAFVCVCHGKLYEITAHPNHDIESRIGPKECAKGSKYWCQDLRTAKQCGAVKHCIQVVWEHKKLPADNNEICETCKKMVAEARDELRSNTTQELIKEVLEGTCSIYFPIKIIANECIKMVDEFIPELIEILASRMDPQTVCYVAWLCNSNKIKDLILDIEIVGGKKKVPQFIEGFSSNSDACADCKQFAVDAIEKVKSMGETEFGQRLLAFCDKLSGALYTICRMTAEKEAHSIYIYVTTQMKPEEVCALAAMCIDGLDPIDKKSEVPKYMGVARMPSADPECELCVQLATRLRDLIVANSSRAEVKQVLLNICSHLKMYKDQCLSYVNNYFDEIYNFLIDELNPKLICQIFGLCVSERRLIGQDEKAAYDKLHPNKIPDVKVKFPFTKPNMSAPVRPPATNCEVNAKNNVQCVLCEYVMHHIQVMLADNKTQESIENALKKVCGLLPHTITEQCNAFVTQYGPAIFMLLAQELDPSLICTELGLCTGKKINLTPILPSPDIKMERLTNPGELQLPIDRMVPTNKNLAGKEECMFCQYSMELIHAVLQMNGTKDAIVLGLDDVCHTLPSTWRNTCDSFVELYAEPFITMLQQQNLTELCDLLSVCSGNVAASMYPHANMAAKAAVDHADSNTCSICEVTVEMLAKLLNNPTIGADVVKAVEQVCLAVPKTTRTKCQSIIEVYGPYFIKMLAEFTDPKVVCQTVHLCDPPLGQVNLLGAKKCTYGPDYWCKSKIHAKACKAEEHCKKFVWKN